MGSSGFPLQSEPSDDVQLPPPRHPRHPRHRQPGGGGEHGDQGGLSSDQLWVSVQQPDLQRRQWSGSGQLSDCGQHWSSVVLCRPGLLLLPGPRPLQEVPQQPLVVRGLCHTGTWLSSLSRYCCSSGPCGPCGSSSRPSGACPCSCRARPPPCPPCPPH